MNEKISQVTLEYEVNLIDELIGKNFRFMTEREKRYIFKKLKSIKEYLEGY